MAATLPFIIFLYVILFPEVRSQKEFFSLKHFFFILFVFLAAGITLFLLGLIFSPDFIARHFSSDGTLKQATMEKISHIRTISIYGGIFLILSAGVTYLLTKFSPRISSLILRIKYSIPYFLILLSYMIIRFLLLGGMGGAYGSSQGNVIFQVGVDAFMRDIFALTALVWPVGINFNIYIFQLQIQHPFIFYSISLIITAGLIFIAYKLIVSRNKSLLFAFFWIFITLIPVHNILVPSWQFQAKYLYLPIAGFCIFVPILLFKLIESKKVSTRFAYVFTTVFIILVLSISSLSIIRSNAEKEEDGKVMKSFVSDMKNYQSKINDTTGLYFISFPYTPVSTNSCMYMYAYMDEVLNYVNKEKEFKEYNYNILSYSKGEDTNNYKINWQDEKNFTIEGIDPSKYYLVPTQTSQFDEEVKEIYKTIPHPELKCLDSEGETGNFGLNMNEPNTASVSVISLNKENDRAKFKVELEDSINKSEKNKLFFIFRAGHFELIKEYHT